MERDVRQAVVLAGGKGTRLRPLTDNRPKPLLPILGKPCIEYALRSLVEAGIEEIFVACGYRANDLVSSITELDLGVRKLVFAFEDEPAGTAGAVKLLETRLEGTFVVASGDVLADVNMGDLIAYHRTKGAFGTMALTTAERPEEFGIVGLDQNGRIERFKEKPAPEEVFSNLINAGIYVLEPDSLDCIPEGEMYDFSKNLFPKLLGMGKPLFGAPIQGMWKDIGRPSDLIEANIQMASRRGVYPQLDGIEPPAHVGQETELGKDVRIHNSVIGSSVTTGHSVRVIDSLVMDGCRLGDGCVVMGSVLGTGGVVGEGARLANVVLGDGAQIPPGSIIEKESLE